MGRPGSPVLDHYPPKDPALSVRGPPAAVTGQATVQPPAAPSSPAPKSGSATPPPAMPLIALERPFDVDEFSQLLGQSKIRVRVPREDLPEVLRRICDFMGFGIYVYAITVRPAPTESLKQFVVELERVDYRPEAKEWLAFQDRGRSESPFGPEGRR